MPRVLCVAEKPSIAKSVSEILSGGQFTTHRTKNQYVKNYEFNYPQTNSFFVVTSVIGHLTNNDFDEAHRKWHSCDPFDLFDAQIENKVDADKKTIEDNLTTHARRADTLMIWTDCDREGEHIGMEIVRVCRKARPHIQIKRARFSAIIAQQIHYAAQNPGELDRQQAAAVEARIILDLRIGAAFTRLQTLGLQNRIPQIGEGVYSYGPCQFPTLGFVVHKWKFVKSFVPEPFWFIYLALTREGEETVFSWKRNHIFDEDVAGCIYLHVMSNPVARVIKVTKKATKKWKPLPLTTVELQKAGSRLLKLAPKKMLDIAEKLYQQGFVSYPRTETDQFDPAFDFHTLIQKQTVDPAWGTFAASLLNDNGFSSPRRGKNNDSAHPPIHPLAHAGNFSGDEKRVYEFITRRFLAACSKDAEGFQTSVNVTCGEEFFSATGLVVLEKNYLLVYPYDKWVGHTLPDFSEGEEFSPSICELRTGQTTKPKFLTEADLITLMDRNGIGTDATIAQHIQTIIDRDYVIENMEGATKYLLPSKLGIGLIEGYNEMSLSKSLSKPQLRRETELSMVQVSQGTKTKADMLEEAIQQYKEMYIIAKREFNKVITNVLRYLDGGQGPEAGHEGRGRGGGGGGGSGNGGGSGGGPPGTGGRGRGRPPGSHVTSASRGRGGQASRLGGGGERTPDSGPEEHNEPPPRPAPRVRPAPTGSTFSNHPGVSSFRPPSPRFCGATSKLPGHEQSAGEANEGGPRCDCGVPAAQRTVMRESVHKGRLFWNCSMSDKCNFFQWADEFPDGNSVIPTKRPYSPKQASDARMCKCNIPVVRKTVTKGGENKGRRFWVCQKAQGQQCGFIEWDDQLVHSLERSKSDAAQPGASSAGVNNGECYMCHQAGHWAKSCPNDDASLKRRRSFGGGPSYPQPSTSTCFKCQQPGHYSNVCPNSKTTVATSSAKGGGGSDKSCFTCGEVGHWSNACPNGRSRSSSVSARGRAGRSRRIGSTVSAKGKRGKPKKKSIGAPE